MSNYVNYKTCLIRWNKAKKFLKHVVTLFKFLEIAHSLEFYIFFAHAPTQHN